jgi:DNA-binding XRE family transcriptional regulator
VRERVPNSINDILKRRKVMKAYPFTYSQVAAVADVSRNTVWNLAHGAYWPMLDTAYKVARALSTTVYEVWGEVAVLEFLRELREEEQDRLMEQLRNEIEEE